MQTLTPQEEGACVGTEMSGGEALPSCRTTNLNPPSGTGREPGRDQGMLEADSLQIHPIRQSPMKASRYEHVTWL
jgi:hypothetical protein